jgi:hypothetical protein
MGGQRPEALACRCPGRRAAAAGRGGPTGVVWAWVSSPEALGPTPHPHPPGPLATAATCAPAHPPTTNQPTTNRPTPVQVRKPNVGENRPAAVTANVAVDLKPLRGDVRSEWDQIRQHDVMFLLTIRPPSEEQVGVVGGRTWGGQFSRLEEFGMDFGIWNLEWECMLYKAL